MNIVLLYGQLEIPLHGQYFVRTDLSSAQADKNITVKNHIISENHFKKNFHSGLVIHQLT